MVVSLSGPSKSGKTVLIEKVVGLENLITVSGAQVEDPADIWSAILSWMDVPSEISSSVKTAHKAGGEATTSGLVEALGAKAGGKYEFERATETKETSKKAGAVDVIKEIANSDYVVLIDDFHYMPKAIQEEAARQIKDAAGKGVKICTASVIHRGDDVVRANPELRGRLAAVDLPYWSLNDLLKIAERGFGNLQAGVSEKCLTRFAEEAAGSPQLMQLICLHACFTYGLRETLSSWRDFDWTDAEQRVVYEAAASATDHRSLFDVVDCGPKERGRERKIYKFVDGSTGDVYRAILKGISSDPPRLSFSYDALNARVKRICPDESPTASSVASSCKHMVDLALRKFPKERAIDWNEERELLDLPDPYFLFYLRWSGRLMEQAD
jgi:hypothetical protein